VLAYTVRVYLLRGFYIVTYGIAIYNLNLVIGFLTPAFDPEAEEPGLPTDSAEAEFKPFVRRLPEFKFWRAPGGAEGAGGEALALSLRPCCSRAASAGVAAGRASGWGGGGALAGGLCGGREERRLLREGGGSLAVNRSG
jgi:hypothetical protein